MDKKQMISGILLTGIFVSLALTGCMKSINKDPQTIDSLVASIVQAPLPAQSPPEYDSDTVYYLIFHLNDGTKTRHRFDVANHILSPPALLLSSDFSQIIQQVVKSAS
jgi:hypothetical protein